MANLFTVFRKVTVGTEERKICIGVFDGIHGQGNLLRSFVTSSFGFLGGFGILVKMSTIFFVRIGFISLVGMRLAVVTYCPVATLLGAPPVGRFATEFLDLFRVIWFFINPRNGRAWLVLEFIIFLSFKVFL